MAKNYGVGVSGWLDPEGRNWETGVYQASKPVLDKELNLTQDNAQYHKRRRSGVPSGWLSPGILDSSDASAEIFAASAVANEYEIPALEAIVNDWQILVRYSDNATTSNTIDLGAGPAGVGAKRTDLVFLEVWRRLISASPDTVGKSAAGRIWRNGNVKIAGADDLTLNLADDILDGSIGSETTKRVQIQYRIRVHQNVNTGAFPQGLDDPTVVANTVPASAAAPNGTPTAYAYANQSANGDPGLWIAGDGNPANGLGTVDGYMYAIPLTAIFRRNTSAFDRDNNHNGGVATPGPSDRPDGLFYDVIDARDVRDLRQHINPSGWSYPELLAKNVNYLFDNLLQNEEEITALGGGSVGHTNLWADEIGPTDNAGAELVRNFDSVARRFSDRSIVETVWVRYSPTDQDGGGPTWSESPLESIVIDPTNLPIYPYPSQNLASVAPSDISIVDITSIVFAWDGTSTPVETIFGGNFDDEEGPTGITFAGEVSVGEIVDLGEVPIAPVTLTMGGFFYNNPADPQYHLYVQLVISYPTGRDATGGGLTKTPTADYSAASFVNETPAKLPAGAPYLYQSMESQTFDYPHREVELTYRTTSQTFSQGFCNFFNTGPVFLGLPTADSSVLFCPDRIATLNSITNVTTGETYTGPANLTADGHYIHIENTSGNWSGSTPASANDEIEIDFEAVRPVPDNDVQFTIWYESRTPQTVASDLLGTTIQVIPRYVCPHLYTMVTGSGSQATAYPFPYQYVQSPGVYPTSGGSFGGDHELDSVGNVATSTFSTDNGFIQLPTLIPMVAEPQNLIFNRGLGDIDAEGRSFFKEVPAGYIPAAFAEPLSDPKRHKNILPMICELAADGSVGPKGTLLLVMLSRWSDLDNKNYVGFDSDLAVNSTSASVYRLKGNPLNNRRR